MLHDKPRIVTVGEAVQPDLPDPTVPVPFERYASLHDSNDALVRAAFWSFHAAWLIDHDTTQTRQVVSEGTLAPHPLAVEARHDGHTLRAITQELAVRDACIITRRDLSIMQQGYEDNLYRASGALMYLWVALAFVVGLLFGLWQMGAFSG